MLLTFLVDSAGGGSSRLSGIVQRGLRIVRQVLRGEKPGSVQGPERGVVKFPQISPPPLVPAGNVLSVVRRNARGILVNYLARNQVDSLAAEMRRRYALQMMSGSVRFYAGLRNKIPLFGFVGVSFGGAVHNHVCTGEKDGHDILERVIHNLFETKPEDVNVSKTLPAEEDNADFLVSRHLSVSDDSDITVLSDTESDFEIITQEETCLFVGPTTEDISFCEEETAIRDVIKTETQQSAELDCLVRQLWQQNAALKELLHLQTTEDIILKRELSQALEAIGAQQTQLVTLRNVIQRQGSLLKSLLAQPEVPRVKPSRLKDTNPGRSGNLKKAVYSKPSSCGTSAVPSEVDGEQLRAEGGRVRGLKIHRKQRLKNS